MQASDVVTSNATPDQLRALQYLFTCDWSGAVTLTNAFSTDITQTLGDNEQRWGLTPVPFRTLEVTLSVYGIVNTAVARNFIARASASRWLVPFYHEEVIMNANGSSVTVFGDFTNKRYFVNQRVAMVRFNNNHCEGVLIGTALIGSVHDDHLVLDTSTTLFQSGDSVFPLMEADVVLNTDLDVTTDQVLTFHLKASETLGLNSTPGLANIGDTPSGFTTFGGKLVINPDPDFTQSSMKVGVSRSGIASAVGQGKVVSLYGDRHRWRYTLNYSKLNRQDATDLIRLFEAVGGRLKPFWVLSPVADLDVVLFSSTTVRVQANFPSADWAFYTHIAVLMKDGSVVLKAINSVTRSGDDIISVDAFSSTPVLADVVRVSFAHLMRFDSDEMKEQWTTDSILVSSFDCIEVLNEGDITLAHITDFIDSCGQTAGSDPDDPPGLDPMDPPPIDPDDPDVFSYAMTATADTPIAPTDPSEVECTIKTGGGADTSALNGYAIVVTAAISGTPVDLSLSPSGFTSSISITANNYSGSLNGFLEDIYFDVDDSNDGDVIDITCTLVSLSTLVASASTTVQAAAEFVMVSSDGTHRAQVSGDGASWTPKTLGSTDVIRAVCYSPTAGSGGTPLHVAVGINCAYTSADGGKTWTPRTAQTGGWSSVCWAGGTINKFVAVNDDFATVTSGANSVMTSPDGVTWTMVTAPGRPWKSVCYSSSLDKLVVVGSTGSTRAAMKSGVGNTTFVLTTAVSPMSNALGVVWAGTQFVAVGSGHTYTSPDGETWTSHTGIGAGQYNKVCWSGSLLVAVGNAGLIATGTDGSTWSPQTSPNSNNWTSVCWSTTKSKFVATAGAGTNRTMVSGALGNSWAANAEGETNIIQGVCSKG